MTHRVLVIEDEEAYRETLKYVLTNEGFDVQVAANGAAGVDAFRDFHPDVVLLDLMLPRMSGTEVLRRIRLGSDVPVIMVTAKDEQHHKIAGLELGADDYVTKPYAARELIARIRAVLRRSAVTHEEALDEREPVETAHGITLNPERLTMERDGKVVPLPPKEFALLLLLMQNRGRVLTRETIIARVWGEDYVGDTKTLDVHMKRLRSRIEDVPAEPRLLVTVRSVGYTMEDEGHG
ncbi:MAG: DNA-binding response regulator [Actinobacteria bacterium HGW-Actinobacteria-4]|nr:MAG: DNA-binding response regulator [Actinobacteria bacterium HGW-Actinobacteria-4]